MVLHGKQDVGGVTIKSFHTHFGKLAKHSFVPIWPDELGGVQPQSRRRQCKHRCPCQTWQDCGIYKVRSRPRLENLGRQIFAPSPMEAGQAWSIRPSICPDPYTSLAQFHRKVMPFAHPDLPHARQPPYPGGVAVGAGHMWYTPSSGRPDHVMCVVTSGHKGKATVIRKNFIFQIFNIQAPRLLTNLKN